MRYRIQGMKRDSGEPKAFEVEAPSEDAAVKMAGERGYVVESIRPAPGTPDAVTPGPWKAVPQTDVRPSVDDRMLGVNFLNCPHCGDHMTLAHAQDRLALGCIAPLIGVCAGCLVAIAIRVVAFMEDGSADGAAVAGVIVGVIAVAGSALQVGLRRDQVWRCRRCRTVIDRG